MPDASPPAHGKKEDSKLKQRAALDDADIELLKTYVRVLPCRSPVLVDVHGL